MTLPKRPLPPLRFVIFSRGKVLFELIPQTTPKGRVIPDLWAVPGGSIKHTDELTAWCLRRDLTWEINHEWATLRSPPKIRRKNLQKVN